MASIGGLGSGLDTAAMVDSLMKVERLPEQRWNIQRQNALTQQTAWQAIKSKLSLLQVATYGLDSPTKASGSLAASSDTAFLTASAANGAPIGTTSVKVVQLATSQQRTSGPLSSSTTLVGASRFTLASGLGATGTGFTGVTADPGTAAGVHTLEVTAVPAPPRVTGSSALPATTTFADGANTLTLTDADSNQVTVTFTAGKAYTASAITSAINDALGTAGKASLSGSTLVLSGAGTGPASSLTVGGTAADALHLGTSTVNGADAEITVDGGAPQAITLNGTNDVVVYGKTAADPGFTLTPGTLLHKGKIAANVVETTATTTVQQLSDKLRGTGSPTSSSLVDLGDGTANSLRLVLSATGTGSAGSLAFSGTVPPIVSGLTTTAAAKDAVIEVAGNTITRSTNSITDVIPGVTLGLVKASDQLVTVSTSRDTAGLTSKAKGLVDALNNALSEIETQTKYSATTGGSTNTNGPLAGNASARSIASAIFTSASSTSGSGETRALSQLGLTTTREGRFALDADTLSAQLAKDPDGVASIISRFAKAAGSLAKQNIQTDGSVSTQAASAGETATRLQRQIDDFEVRMVAMQKRLKAQYAAMDTALGSLSQRQSQLSAALSGL